MPQRPPRAGQTARHFHVFRNPAAFECPRRPMPAATPAAVQRAAPIKQLKHRLRGRWWPCSARITNLERQQQRQGHRWDRFRSLPNCSRVAGRRDSLRAPTAGDHRRTGHAYDPAKHGKLASLEGRQHSAATAPHQPAPAARRYIPAPDHRRRILKRVKFMRQPPSNRINATAIGSSAHINGPISRAGSKDA